MIANDVVVLTDEELEILVKMGEWGAVNVAMDFFLLTHQRALLRFKKVEREFRNSLKDSPESLGISAAELKRIAFLYPKGHSTEDCELRFSAGAVDWFIRRSLPTFQRRVYRPGSGQTISLRGRQAPTQIGDKRQW